MRRTAALAFLVSIAVTAAARADTASLPTAPQYWIQYTSTGVEARAVVTGTACPTLSLDGHDAVMQQRAAATPDFPEICSLLVPAGAKTLVVKNGPPLTLPVAHPQRILVLGDTGCRIKGSALQACNDPNAWPFPHLAAAAAALKPDLVLHLGDYLYRESSCPKDFAGCQGSPWGDNWASWRADFFEPAAPLLAAAPWIIVRGNHEDCYRAGPGFLRLLGPAAFDPAAPCDPHLKPYAVSLGDQTIAIMDSASAPDTSVDAAQVPLFKQDFDTLAAMAAGSPQHEVWLASHRPIWAAITFMGMPAGGNATMIKAAGDLSDFQAIALMLAGHIHAFEAINYVDRIPPQIVAGHGGDNLDVTPADLHGTVFQGDSGVHVKTGLSVGGFGFLMLTRGENSGGWTIQLYDSDGHALRQCEFEDRSIVCLKPL